MSAEVAAAQMPNARARALPSNAAVMIESEPGTRSAPANPWSSRARTRISIVGASPQRTEVRPNPAEPDQEDAATAVLVRERPGEHEERREHREVAARDVGLGLERARGRSSAGPARCAGGRRSRSSRRGRPSPTPRSWPRGPSGRPASTRASSVAVRVLIAATSRWSAPAAAERHRRAIGGPRLRSTRAHPAGPAPRAGDRDRRRARGRRHPGRSLRATRAHRPQEREGRRHRGRPPSEAAIIETIAADVPRRCVPRGGVRPHAVRARRVRPLRGHGAARAAGCGSSTRSTAP